VKQGICAIETRYKGYRFRSRLEARWAVFFDALGLRWEYEPEGFHTEAGPYLPDFRVMTPQGQPVWYEVKPEGTSEDRKLVEFETALRQSLKETDDLIECVVTRVALLSGDPISALAKPGVTICPRCGFICKPACGFDAFKEGHPRLDLWRIQVGCEPCDFETPSGGGNPWEDGIMGIGVTPHKGAILAWASAPVLPFVTKAAEKARSARFEHGETP
jgi:hypothetical protein